MVPFSQNLFVPWYNNSPFQAYLYLIGDSLPTIDRLSCKDRAIFALIKMATGLDGLLFTLTTTLMQLASFHFQRKQISQTTNTWQKISDYTRKRNQNHLAMTFHQIYYTRGSSQKKPAIMQIDVTTNTYQTKIQQHIHQ